jgi:ADP-ribose pyrophosphatase YjhB (NUDIX family)
MTKTTRSEDYSLSVYAIIQKRGRILLTQDTYKPGWKLPGGGVEARELILEALKREVREEVGLKIRPGRPLLMANWLKKGTSMGRMRIYFVADHARGEIDLTSGEVAKARWFSKRELRELKEDEFLHPRHYHEAVKRYLGKGAMVTTFQEIPERRRAISAKLQGATHAKS